MQKGSKPVVNAMLICDKVLVEAGTSKKSLIGIFENIKAYKFPCGHPFLAVYIKLTDANGMYKFRLELGSLETGAIVGKAEMPKEINITNPLMTHELVFNLAGLRFEAPGKYEFRIFANGEVFGQKTFQVQKLQAPEKKEPTGE